MNKTDRKRNKTSGIWKTSNNATNHTINDEDHDENDDFPQHQNISAIWLMSFQILSVTKSLLRENNVGILKVHL